MTGAADIIGVPNIRMWYMKQYDDHIILKHGVELCGWPLMSFKNPGDVNALPKLQLLRDKLKDETCYWVRLTNGELAARQMELQAEVAEGTWDPLKWASGTREGGVKHKINGGGQGQRKKARVTVNNQCGSVSDEDKGSDNE